MRLNLLFRDLGACCEEASSLAAGCKRGVLKILLWRGAQPRGYRPRTTKVERLLIRDELPALPPSAWSQGVRVMRSPVLLSQQPRLAGIKHLNRLEQVLASQDWPRGVAEAIQCDASGSPIGGTRCNLFWVSRGALYTPELSLCGVAGMMRQKVLEMAQALRIDWKIGRWSWRDFELSDEAFLTNSLIGIWPLRAIDRRRWRVPGPVTSRLITALAHPLILSA